MTGAITGAVTGGINSSSCFVAGTDVLTSLGLVVIEDICAGDMVWSQDPEMGNKGIKKVIRTFENTTDELVHVYVKNDEIITTTEHPFYVPRRGCTAAIELRAGDILVLQSGGYIVVEHIQHEILESPIRVYNFEVEDFHTYYIGEHSILVHNACCPRGVGGKGWEGDKTWRANLKMVDEGGAITQLKGEFQQSRKQEG